MRRCTADVVGTTERFDLFWLQLADVVGFQHLVGRCRLTVSKSAVKAHMVGAL